MASSLLASALLLAVPGVATGADTFVNDDGGNNANPCTQAQPCQTIAQGVAVAGNGDDVFVDGGIYDESLTLFGESLRELNFNTGDGDTDAIVNGGGAIAITVGGSGTIDGFSILSTSIGVHVGAPATVTNNTFESTAANSTGVSTNEDAGGSTIGPGNSFTDNGVDSESRVGVVVSQAPVLVTGNDFADLSTPITSNLSNPTISANEITGTHTGAFSGVASGGSAIEVGGSSRPTIVGNHIHSPDPTTGAIGISVDSTTGFGGSPGATLRRNRIIGHDPGVLVRDATQPVTLNGDVIMGAATAGLRAEDVDPIAAGQGDVSATNVTLPNNSVDILLDDTALTLDSSLLASGNSIQEVGLPSCTITFSRGQTMNPFNPCQNFQTNAPPMFAGDGYHLLAGSPMIDAGDPTPPLAPNDLDVDGDPRALDGTPTCSGNVARRDIGADEFVPTPPDCGSAPPPGGGTTPPPAGGTTTTPTLTPTTAPPPPPPAKKKCKRKKKGAAAAKKCRKRKR